MKHTCTITSSHFFHLHVCGKLYYCILLPKLAIAGLPQLTCLTLWNWSLSCKIIRSSFNDATTDMHWEPLIWSQVKFWENFVFLDEFASKLSQFFSSFEWFIFFCNFTKFPFQKGIIATSYLCMCKIVPFVYSSVLTCEPLWPELRLRNWVSKMCITGWLQIPWFTLIHWIRRKQQVFEVMENCLCSHW